MNKFIISSRLTEDVKTKTLPSGTVTANFSVAVKRDRKNENGDYDSDFFNIVVFGKLAENCQKYLKKGSQALICGAVQNRSYEAKDGTKRYITEVIANEVEFISGYNQSQKTAIQTEMTPIDDSDEIPF